MSASSHREEPHGRVVKQDGMMISKRQPESSTWPLKSVQMVFLPLFVLFLMAGCHSGQSPAPASNHVFTQSQAAVTLDVLETMARESPRDPVVALDLLPDDGIRWATIRDAVAHAVAVPELEMAISETVRVSDSEQKFYLFDSNSWPARVWVKAIDESPGVEIEVLMGPDPHLKRNQARARDMEKRILDSIIMYGKIKRLEPYEIKMTPRRLMSPVDRTRGVIQSTSP